MKRFLLVFLFGAVCSLSAATEPTPTPAPPMPVIFLPADPAPAPPPPPAPGTASKLPADQLYVIRASVPVIVTSSPPGLLKITADTGPVKVRARFTDGNGKTQCRTFSEKYVYLLEAAGVGTAEILIVPSGATDESAVIRRTLAVDNGETPPAPTPPPTPPAPADPLTARIQSAYSADPDPLKASHAASLALIWSAAVQQLDSPSVTDTTGDFHAKMAVAIQAVIGKGALPSVQAVIGEYLTSTLGSTSTKLDAATRTKAGAAFTAIAKALTGCK